MAPPVAMADAGFAAAAAGVPQMAGAVVRAAAGAACAPGGAHSAPLYAPALSRDADARGRSVRATRVRRTAPHFECGHWGNPRRGGPAGCGGGGGGGQGGARARRTPLRGACGPGRRARESGAELAGSRPLGPPVPRPEGPAARRDATRYVPARASVPSAAGIGRRRRRRRRRHGNWTPRGSRVPRPGALGLACLRTPLTRTHSTPPHRSPSHALTRVLPRLRWKHLHAAPTAG